MAGILPRFVAIAATLVLAACASTSSQPPPAVKPGQELYAVDPSHTFPHFEVSHSNFSLHRGRFNRTSGWIVLDRAAREGYVELTIDADSIDTGDPALEQRLRAQDFFDTAAYPEIKFRSSKLRFSGDNVIGLEGELTLRGVTRPVTLTVTRFRCDKHPLTRQSMCGANAETTVKRADFGISVFPSMIGGDVTLQIQIEAHRH